MKVALNILDKLPASSEPEHHGRPIKPFKIVLADPPAKDDDYDKAYPNLGILQLISYLRQHTPLSDDDIIFLDQFHSLEDHIRVIERYRPQLYGLSFAFLTQRVAYRTINELKRRFPEILIIAGGPQPTAAADDVMKKSLADLVCIGEGELTLAGIVNEMLRPPNHNPQSPTPNRQSPIRFADIAGLLIRTPDGPFRTPDPRVIPNLDDLPLPAWAYIDFGKFVGQHYSRSHRQSCIVISRGCPHKCTFCSLPVWRAARPFVRLRSPESIAEEVDRLYRLGVREIKMVSDEINVALPWAKNVCRAIADLGHKDLFFQSNLRADKIDDELAHLFKRMNMWLVHLGVESANDRVLHGIDKKITVEQTERCLKLLKRHKIRVLLFMMAFQLWEEDGKLQFEEPGEIRHSLWWAWKQFLRRRISYMTWSIATPMPGAPLYEIVDRHGLEPAEQVLDNWQLNKDYLGIDLTSVGINEKAKLRLLRAGILSKGVFAMLSGNFDWRRHFYRIGILTRSFLGKWNTRAEGASPILNTPLRAKVEG
ncbi:MAG: B12-binding domain-containing radical SAM protein [Phycisphaerales bacterium]|nr:MAG: B12-binding domain-containing radical SAM protein [Phycisphaerales bacterium]